MNAALQGLFMIRGFREGLFAVEEPIADSPIVLHIRQAAGALTLLCATQENVSGIPCVCYCFVLLSGQTMDYYIVRR